MYFKTHLQLRYAIPFNRQIRKKIIKKTSSVPSVHIGVWVHVWSDWHLVVGNATLNPLMQLYCKVELTWHLSDRRQLLTSVWPFSIFMTGHRGTMHEIDRWVFKICIPTHISFKLHYRNDLTPCNSWHTCFT